MHELVNSETTERTDGRPRSQRHLRRLLFLFLSAAILLLFLELVLHFFVARSVDLEEVQREATAALGRPVTASAIQVSAIYGLVLENVEVRERGDAMTPGALILHAERVRLRPSWKRLLLGRFEVASVKILRGDVHAIRDSQGWNLSRLWAEKNAEPTHLALTPSLEAEDLRVWFTARGALWDGWMTVLRRLSVTSTGDRVDAAISSVNGEPCDIEAVLRPDEGLCEIEFEDLPTVLARFIHKNAGWESLEGRVNAAWTVKRAGRPGAWFEAFRIEGEGEGRSLSLPIAGGSICRFEHFRLKRALYESTPDTGWQAVIEDLRVGRPNASPLRLGVVAAGNGGRLSRCKLEWDGPAEKILALVPPSFTRDVARYRPTGGSAGHVLIGARGSAPWVSELALQARGLTLTLPETSPVEFVRGGTVLSEIRGRVTIADDVLRMSALSFAWDGDVIRLEGNVARPGDGARARYDVQVEAAELAAARLGRWMPEGLTLDGKIGASLRLTPGRVRGAIRCLGNTLEHAEIGRLRLVEGGFLVDGDSPATAQGLAIAAGDGRVVVDGVLPHGSTRRMNLELRLQEASLDPFARLAAFDSSFALSGGRVNGLVMVSGPASAPAIAGNVQVREVDAVIEGLSWGQLEGPVRFAADSFASSGLRGSIGGGKALFAGSYAKREARFTLGLENADASILASLAREAFAGYALSGPVNASLSVSGQPTRPSVSGTLVFRGTELRGERDLHLTQMTGQLEIHPDRFVARDVAAQYLDAPARLKGTVPLAESVAWSLSVSMEQARLEHFSNFAPAGFSGEGAVAGLAASFTGPKSAPRVTGSARLLSASVRTPFLASPLGEVTGDLSFGADSLALKAVSFRTGRTTLTASGGIERFDDPVLRSFRLHAAEADVGDLLALVPEASRPLPKGTEIHGAVRIDSLTLSGPLDRAAWNGRVTLVSVGGRLPGLTRGASDISGEILFAGSQMKAPSLRGRIGQSEVWIENARMELAPPYELHLNLAIREAVIEELFGAIPRPESLESLSFAGRGNIACSVTFNGSRLLLEGNLNGGAVEGFGMPFKDVSGRFRYDGASGLIVMRGLQGEWAGGRTRNGSLVVNVEATPPMFEASGDVQNADFAEILRLNGFRSDGYAGRLDGSLKVTGRFGAKDSVNGEGSVTIRRARFENLRPLDAISRNLRMDFFSKGTYETARGVFTIEKGVIRTQEPEHFRFNSPNYALEARGYTSLEGECVYNFACGIQAGVVGNLMSALQISRLFSLSGEGGVLRAAGTIRGRIDNPVVNVDLGVLNLFSR